MAKSGAQRVGMEPLARLLRECMDAQGFTVADLARFTNLDRRHVSQIVNRSDPYKREPSIETMQKLAEIPGLSIDRIALAIAESTGRPVGRPVDIAPISPMRRSAHGMIDQIAEEELPRVLKYLATML